MGKNIFFTQPSLLFKTIPPGLCKAFPYKKAFPSGEGGPSKTVDEVFSKPSPLGKVSAFRLTDEVNIAFPSGEGGPSKTVDEVISSNLKKTKAKWSSSFFLTQL